jgi:cytidylate kinase
MSRLSHARAGANLEARIAAHLEAWKKSKQSGQSLALEVYPFVTISREYGCEAIPLSLRLSETLNERCRPHYAWIACDQEIFDKVVKESKAYRDMLESLDERRRNKMGKLLDTVLNRGADEAGEFRKRAELVRSLALHGHVVLIGRGSHFATQDLKTGMHVRLVAPRGLRVSKIATEREMTHQAVERVVREAEQRREQFLQTFFVQDPAHPFHYDLVIDNSRFNLDQIVEIIFTALGARFGETLVGA